MILLINLWIIASMALLWLVVVKTGFYKNGFVAKKHICSVMVLFFICSCMENNEDSSLTSQEALMNWHYGFKNSDYDRFNKIIFGERIEQVKLALRIYQPLHDFDIVWLKDSLVGLKLDTAFVFYQSIDTEWGNIRFCKRFVLVDNEWKTTLKDR